MTSDRQTPSSNTMIQTENLGLLSGDALALRGLNLRIERGEIFGLIGPLGSGKSTTLKLLAGMLPLQEGRAWVDGLDVVTQSADVRARIGYMPGYMGAYDNLQVRGYLEFFARACQVDPIAGRAHIDRLIELAGLTDQAEAYMSSLDAEACRRLAVVKTAVADPPVLFFDDPAVGLSMAARLRLRQLIGELTKDGDKTVLICTNILTDLLGLCGRIGVIRGGNLLTAGPTAAVARRLTGARVLELETTGNTEVVLRLLEEHSAIDDAAIHGDHVLASLAGEIEDPGTVIQDIIAQGGAVTAYREHQIELDLLVEQIIQT